MCIFLKEFINYSNFFNPQFEGRMQIDLISNKVSIKFLPNKKYFYKKGFS